MRLGDSEVLEQAAAHVWRGKGSADEKKLRTLGTLRTFRVEKVPNRCMLAPPGSSKWKSHLLGPGESTMSRHGGEPAAVRGHERRGVPPTTGSGRVFG